MAKLVAKAATDMDNWENSLDDASEADVAEHNDEHFVANSDVHTFVGTGHDLEYSSLFGRTVPTGGTINSFTVFDKGGPELFSIHHMDEDAEDFSTDAASDDWDAIAERIFGHNDRIIGSDKGDHFLGFDGNDKIMGNAGADTLEGGGGADKLTGGQGADTFGFRSISSSTGRTGHDTITDLHAGTDTIALIFPIEHVDSTIHNADLSKHNFDDDLADVTSGLDSHHAVLVEADNSSPYAGHVFLVLNADGTAGYQAGDDMVIDVTGITGTLTTGTFEEM